MSHGRFVWSVIIAFALVGAACGGGGDETPSGSAAGSGSYSVGMALPRGRRTTRASTSPTTTG